MTGDCKKSPVFQSKNMGRKKDPVLEVKRKYDKTIKDAVKLYKLTQKGIPKKDRIPFEKTKDYKILKKRQSNAVYRIKNRDKDLARKVEYRKKIKEQVQNSKPKMQVVLSGPVFEVLSYAQGGLLFEHAQKLFNPFKQKYIGIINFIDANYTYTTTQGFFDRIRQIFAYARTVDSGIMARVSELNSKDQFAQMVEIFASESEVDA